MNLKTCLILIAAMGLALTARADIVVEDQGVSISRAEMEQLVKRWTPDMQQAAANDAGDQIELLSLALASKKMAKMADDFPPEKNPDLYWKLQFAIQNMKRDFVVTQFVRSLKAPEMDALVEERYKTEKDKYAKVPESRKTSHILLMCPPMKCRPTEQQQAAEDVRQRLLAGENFENLAKEFSEDPGSKNKGGVFSKPLTMDVRGVDQTYLEAAFEITAVGEYSPVIRSQFGYHIIRLDELQEAYYKPLEEVSDEITKVLVQEYVKLKSKEFDASFRLTQEAFINTKTVDKIFAPYVKEKQ